MGRAVRRSRSSRGSSRAAVAGIRLADARVRRWLLDTGVTDSALGCGVGSAGRLHAGQRYRDAGSVVAPDRAGGASPAPRRAGPLVGHGGPVDLSLGAGRPATAP